MMRVALLAWPLLLGCAPDLVWYGHSADRSQRLEVRQRAERQWLVAGERQSPRYDAIAFRELLRSPRGSRVAFAALRRDRSGRERWQVVVDLKPGREWDAVSALTFDPRGTRFAYLAQQSGAWRVVADGRPGPGFDAIDADSLDFGPGGKRLSYVAFDAGCARAVIDGHVGPCRSAISALALAATPAGDLELASGAGAGTQVYVGGAPVLALAQAALELVTDATREHWVVAVAGDGLGQRARLIGREGTLVEADALGHVAFAPGGSSLAFTAREGGEWRVVVARVSAVGIDIESAARSRGYRAIEAPVFSGDGRHVGYVARTEGSSEVVVDGRVRVRVPTPTATALTLSADGARVSFVHRDARGPVLVVDRAAYRYDVIVEGSLRFDADGRHWALLAGELARRRLFVVVDGRVRLPFDSRELFGGGLGQGDPIELLGRWVHAELERYLARGAAS